MHFIYFLMVCLFLAPSVNADQSSNKGGQYVDRTFKIKDLVTIATPKTCKSEIEMELLIGPEGTVQPVIYCLDDNELPAALHYRRTGFKYFLSEVFRLQQE